MIVDGKIEGKVIYLGEEQTVGKNDIRKKTFVIEENETKDYKSSLAIDLIKDRVDLADDINVGDVVQVSVNFRANEYKGKYYNSITAWRIDKTGAAPAASAEGTEDDLPF